VLQEEIVVVAQDFTTKKYVATITKIGILGEQMCVEIKLKFFLHMFPLFGHFYHTKTNAMFFKKLWQCWLKLCS
jgi:hypothetical protein